VHLYTGPTIVPGTTDPSAKEQSRTRSIDLASRPSVNATQVAKSKRLAKRQGIRAATETPYLVTLA
jgi:hypothetical protein